MRNIKKSVMGTIISVFVLILIVSILAGLTFLFVGQLKTQSISSSQRTTINTVNESVTFDDQNTIQTLDGATAFDVVCDTTPVQLTNTTLAGEDLLVGNVTLTSDCTLINATALESVIGNGTVYVSYEYNYIAGDDATAYNAINSTEDAGFGIVGYLPLVFLALIFGAILTLVLKIILPYINLGNNMGGF